MQKTFDPQSFVKILGSELISEFEKAGLATHSGAIGMGRESSIRMKLKGILPAGVGIGSGFVIDSFGNTSRQCDIILYEEMYATKFILNNDDSNTYYSCENVIAVGEIKSTLAKKEFVDSCEKLKIVKQLKKFCSTQNKTYRPYFNPIDLPAVNGFDPVKNKYHQIYTFILCKDMSISFKSIIEEARVCFADKYLYFNMLMSLADGLLLYLNRNTMRTEPSAVEATDFYVENSDENFNKFIADLIHFIEHGGTTYCPKARYFCNNKTKSIKNLEQYPI